MTTTLRAGSPEDLLAAVPIVLGFHPDDSVVMLTFDAPRTFHARVDLPSPNDLDDLDALDHQVSELCEALRAPCLVHGVARVAFVIYSRDVALVTRVSGALRASFASADIAVVGMLRAHGGRWWPVPSGRGQRGRPYDAVSHPFAAQAVFEGHVTHASREELRETLAGDADAQARVTECRRRLGPSAYVETDSLLEALGRWVETLDDPDDEEAARLLLAVGRTEARDSVLMAVSRETARDHLRVWSGLLRRAPVDQVAVAAVLTAFAAWQAGHGALAWCALDRCFDVEPQHALARQLAECLARAVPPSAWDEATEPPAGESDSG